MTAADLSMTRTFDAPPEALWRAWTTEQGLAGWWWHTWPDTTYRVDARPGGSYRIEAADHSIAVHGEFLELLPPHRMVFSWIWVDDGVDGDVEQVTVTFSPDGTGTRVDLRHSGPWTDQRPADDYRQGWTFVLDALAGALAAEPAADLPHHP